MFRHCTPSELSAPLPSCGSLPSAAYVLTGKSAEHRPAGCAVQVRAPWRQLPPKQEVTRGKMGEAVRRKVVGEVIGNLHRPARPNPTVGQCQTVWDSPAKPGDKSRAQARPKNGVRTEPLP